MVAGVGIEPTCKRLMRPLPFHLATPQWIEMKVARRLGAAPSSQSFGGFAAQAGARRVVVFEMERSAGIAPASPEWRSGILLLNDDREKFVEIGPVDRQGRMSGAGVTCGHPRRIYTTKRTNTAASIRHEVEGRTRWNHFTAVLSVFQAHLPCVTKRVSYAKPLDWKMPGRGNHQTIQGC